MDKLKTRILLISVLLLLLFSVQSVVAVSNDDDGNLTSESIDLSICDNTGDISSNELSNNPVDVLSVSNELDVLSADEVSYSELDSEISVGGNIELLHDYYRCYGGESTISISGNNRVIDGRGAVIDMAGSTIRAFNVVGSGITIKNLTIKNANFNGNGAAIYFSSHGTVENCNFTNNSAKYGGAITFESIGTVRNCNFTNNSARIGGAITFEMMLGVTHEVSNCKFVNNKATALGGAVYFVDNGEVTNCNFTDNLASEGGGAIMFNSAGNVTDCNFTNNNATRYGGAIYFYSNGQSSNVTNCNFTDNSANCGGAVYFRYSGNGTVTNCNFTINTADYGGSIYFESSSGNVVSCNFVNGSSYYGGAVFWLGDNGCISDCNFTGNTAVRRGGAVHWGDTETEPDSQSDYEKAKNGTITRSNFINNTAAQGGAVFWFANDGNITDNCYFKDNNATAEGGAVYWKGNKGHISNKCTFTDNEAITYGGAIFWQGDNGALTDNCRFIKNSAYSQGTEGIYRGGGAIFWNGNNATVSDNCSFINNTADTSEGGGFLDSYRGGGAIYITGTESHVSDSSFVGNYAAHYGGAVYAVGGNSNVDGCSFENNSAKKGGAAFTAASDYSYISNCIFVNNFGIDFTSNGGAVNFRNYDNSLSNCTFIDNYAEDCGGAVYWLRDGRSDVFNCSFENNHAYSLGGALFCEYGADISYCSFVNNGVTGFSSSAGAIYMGSAKSIENCNFTNNTASSNGGAVYFNKNSEGNVTNCNFTDNTATGDGGAVYFSNTGTVSNCNFTNNTATISGGAVFFLNTGNVTNCNFINNTANQSGGAVYVDGAYSDSKINSTFINNQAYNGGAIYFKGGISNVSIGGVYKDNVALRGGGAIFVRGNSMNNNFTAEFTGNEARAASGGAIFIYNQADNNRFEGIYRDNWALYGGGIFFYNKANNNVFNTEFINNTAKSCGGAMFFHNTTDGNNFTGDFTNNRALGQVDSENGNGGAITFKDTSSNSLFNSDFINNNASLNGGGVNYRHTPYNITFNSNFINNTSPRGGGVNFFETFENVVFNGEFIGNSADNGGAIATVGGIIMDVSFKDNHAEDEGGAVYFKGSGVVENCIFTNNTADYGGAVYIFGTGEVRDCVFINNTGFVFAGALMMIYGTVSDSSFTGNTAHIGGAVRINGEATVTRCNFTDNTATLEGGAVYLGSPGNVAFSNFIGNKATGDGVGGGAVLLYEGGNVSYSNFTNNHVSTDGGAVHFYDNGTLSDCNFYDNEAGANGGAVYFYGNGDVTNCNFTNNSARYGGAIEFDGTGTVTNCNFTNNTATNGNGGAIWMYSGSVENCNFTNNFASNRGGAVYFYGNGDVTNCNFTGNNANTGSAIYFYSTSATKTVSNSRFLNNRANAEALEVTKNYNNITITFTGKDNLLNAIYSRNDAEVTFTNVTYWSANGIAKTGSSAIKPSRSNKEAGQNITVSVIVNGKIVLTGVYLTDENGTIVLDIKAGENYFIGARHDTDSYYTEAEKTISNNTKFSVNVTSQTTNNRTVNITAKSNIPNEIIDGKLLFILPNSEEISANYGGNGTWWAVHTFDDYGVYEVNASYTGLDNVTVNNGTVTINDVRLSVVKSADKTEVTYNSTVQFTINITNYGSTEATNVEVSDWLPEGLTFIEAGVINSEGQYEVFDSPDLLILIGDEEFVTFFEFSSSDIIEDGGVERDIAQWSITRIAGGNSVILLITARANGLVMGNITNEVTVWYHENETDSIVNSTNITVIPANSSVSAEDVEVTYGDSIVVVVTSENATGVSYKVIGKDGIVKEGTVNVGENITGLDLAAGDYTINLTTMVNGNYTSSNYTSKITVKPANSSVSAEDVEVTYGDSIVVVVTSDNATGVSYMVIGKEGIVKEGTVNVGENITGLDLAAGDYTVNLTTMVNGNYATANYTSKITVKPANSSVKAEDVEVTYGDSIVVVVTSENATNVSYQIISSGAIVKEGTINIGENITGLDLAAGEYTVNLTTVVNSNYTAANYTSKITVKPANSTVSAEDAVASFGDAVSIPVSSVNATEISYRIIDANDKAVANGTVKPDNPISVSDLAAGDYTVSLTTVVDENHTSVSNSSKLHIRHVVSIVIAPVTGYACETVSFTVQFKYENGDPVSEGTAGLTVKYDNKELLAASRYPILSADESVPVSNGKATFNVKVDNPGTYPYVVTYSGGDADDVQAESTLTILKVNTTVSGVDISGKPDDKKDVTVTVLDYNNNPVANGTVTLTLNGKTYNSTVENGKAVLSVELPNPGEYNATVTYKGNDHYDSSSSSISVNVEKVNTKAPSAEDVSGKAGEKKDIKVKIVDENGNPVKNGTATLTVDGKTYTAEVINGVATFKGVVIPDEDTVADVYYQGNDYYNASSATISIKVKHDNNNTEPDNNDTDENKTTKHVSSEIVDANATGNPIAMMLLALCALVITYRKK